MALKPYNLGKINSPGWALICPRRGCAGRTIVSKRKLLTMKKESGVKTITCPYCSRVSLIPK